MRNWKSRRFGAHEVKKGKFKGCLHVATEAFQKFFSELLYLHDYLDRRLLPSEPEEVLMRGVLLNLQNILEHESEELVKHYVHCHPSKRNQSFERQMEDGFVSFKSKFEWLYKKSLIAEHERDIMEKIRVLRNTHIHSRPIDKRSRYKYSGKPLLTKAALRRMFVDVETVRQKLREQCGKKSEWKTVPPGYASEMKWSEEAIAVLDKK